MYSFTAQSIGFKSVINARDLGGYVLPDGHRIRRGLLLRGGALDSVCDDELRRLSDEFHLAKIFDFRTSAEVSHKPDKEVKGADNIWLPAFNEETMTMDGLSLPAEAYRHLGDWLAVHSRESGVQAIARGMYKEMVTREFTQVQYMGFLHNIIATPQGAIYCHCSQGKDRTGIGCAFLLAALGADRELIMQDFAISAEYYADELARHSANLETQVEQDVVRAFISVNTDYFSEALDLIDSQYGSMEDYLRDALFISEEDRETLRLRYLE